MKRVYLAGPISKGDLAHNINQASEAFARLALAGLSPLCPQWSAFSGGAHWSHFGDVVRVEGVATATGCGLSHADWLRVDLLWVAVCDAVLRLPGESVGAEQETAFAKMNGIPVFTDERELLMWAGGN